MCAKNLSDSTSNRDSKGRFIKGVRYSPQTEFKKGEHWRKHSVFREKTYLLSEYQDKKRSAMEIAQEHGVTEATILYWLKKNNIKARTVSETRKIKYWGVAGEKNPMFGKHGALSPAWKNGLTPERQSVYAKSAWKQIMKFVYTRDNHQCKRCGTSGTDENRLHTHHIKPWKKNPDSRLDKENIILLCRNCHVWVHSRKNTGNEYIQR